MNMKVVKTTTKGQITLPKNWRSRFDTDNFLLEIAEKQIIVKPIKFKELNSEEIIFDAERDNDGKGVPVDEMIKLLKKIRNE